MAHGMIKKHIGIPTFPLGETVPRILHQHFLAGDAAIPEPIRAIRDGLRAANPGWTYSFWDAERAEAWMAETYGRDVLARYLSIRPEYYAARSDLLRYLNLYAEGGVYFDIKSTCDRPLDAAIRPEDRYILMPWEADQRFQHPELAHMPDGEYAQWAIVSVGGHPYLRAVIQRVLANIGDYAEWRNGVGMYSTLRVTGPIAYTLAIEDIRPSHPHTRLALPSERGFRYSALTRGDSHRPIFGLHYAEIKTPMVTPSPVDAAILQGVRWIKRFPPAAAAVRFVRSVLVPGSPHDGSRPKPPRNPGIR
jgi:inositol phosphorylceramide mannosyltransferase catalytic subunit